MKRPVRKLPATKHLLFRRGSMLSAGSAISVTASRSAEDQYIVISIREDDAVARRVLDAQEARRLAQALNEWAS